ncbi:MAG: LysM peptidoglycan-binding domain-containing protein [bacterium]
MKRHYRGLAAGALLVGACARPPLGELDAAWRSYQNASAAGAAERDTQRFQEAGSALVEGQDWIDQGDYEQAREALKRARRLADATAAAASPAAAAPADTGFTDAPPSREGVELSPLLDSRGGAKTAPVEPPAAVAPPAAEVPQAPPASRTPAPLPEHLDPAPPAALPAPEPEAAPRPAPSPEDTARAIREERERLTRATEQAPESEEPAPAAAPAREPVEPAVDAGARASASRNYTVQKGDTLASIARAQYRNEQAWTLIYAANRDRLSHPSDVRAGMRLVLPPASTPIPSAAESVPASRASGTTYTVRKGETLYSIAKKMYGSTTYWTLIRDANRAKIEASGDVRAGTKLVLPPRPSGR